MEFVLLPIFDADGFDTGKRMKINTRYFLGAARSDIAHRDIEVVKPTPVEEEMDMVNRIIAGLPPRPNYVGPIDFERNQPTGLWDFIDQLESKRLPSAHFTLERDGTVTKHVRPEDVEFKPGDDIVDLSPESSFQWKTVPQLDMFEVNQIGMIRHRKTLRDLPLHHEGGERFYVVKLNGIATTLYPEDLIRELFN